MNGTIQDFEEIGAGVVRFLVLEHDGLWLQKKAEEAGFTTRLRTDAGIQDTHLKYLEVQAKTSGTTKEEWKEVLDFMVALDLKWRRDPVTKERVKD